MAVNQWRFVYANKDFIPQGELFNASDRTLSIALSKIDTATFSVRTDHPFASALLSLEGFLKIYRNDTLLFYGPLMEVEESVGPQEGKITVNCTSPAALLQHRFPVLAANSTVFGSGTTRGSVAQALISICNTQYYNYTEWPSGFGGYATDINTPDKMRQTGHTMVWGTLGPLSYPFSAGGTLTSNWPVPLYKPLLEIIQDLASGTDGFDWRFMPSDNFASGAWTGNGGIAEPWFAAPLGSTAPEAIFEFGDGKLNIRSYTRTMSRAQQANSVRHLVNGAPEANPPYAFDNPSRAKWSVMEDLAQAELTDVGLRQTLVNEHVSVRKIPRHTIVFEPTPDYGNGRLPRYDIDYKIGDTVTARAVSLGKQRFNAQFRVWGVEFSIDEFGVETPKLTLSDS